MHLSEKYNGRCKCRDWGFDGLVYYSS